MVVFGKKNVDVEKEARILWGDLGFGEESWQEYGPGLTKGLGKLLKSLAKIK